jgi:hypothetical protein
MSDLLSYTETQRLLDELPVDYQKLVADVIPSKLTVTGLQRILQNLVSERVSIRDMPSILEGISEAAAYTKNPLFITEHVRSRLARQLCDSNTGPAGFVPLATLSPDWEQAFADALVGDGEEKQLAMAPSQLQGFINAVREGYEKFGQMGEIPVMLTSPGIRPYVRSVVERFPPANHHHVPERNSPEGKNQNSGTNIRQEHTHESTGIYCLGVALMRKPVCCLRAARPKFQPHMKTITNSRTTSISTNTPCRSMTSNK